MTHFLISSLFRVCLGGKFDGGLVSVVPCCVEHTLSRLHREFADTEMLFWLHVPAAVSSPRLKVFAENPQAELDFVFNHDVADARSEQGSTTMWTDNCERHPLHLF